MLEHSRTIPGYHIIRYEDMIARPVEALQTIYSLAGLDGSLVKMVRLEAKRVIDKDGEHLVVGNLEWKEMRWYDLDEFAKRFRTDANENQINRLSEEQKRIIQDRCAFSLEKFGYL
jgi:hypothetical protein